MRPLQVIHVGKGVMEVDLKGVMELNPYFCTSTVRLQIKHDTMVVLQERMHHAQGIRKAGC